MAYKSFEELDVWKRSCRLAVEVSRAISDCKQYAIRDQMQRAAISIPSNIAEGQARHTTGEFVQFISHAEGSAAELDTQLILSEEFKFCGAARLHEMISEVPGMLNSLRRKLIARR